MMIKLKDICVDINRPKSLDDLKRLKNVCKIELKKSQIEKSKKDFLIMIINMVDNKLEKYLVLC